MGQKINFEKSYKKLVILFLAYLWIRKYQNNIIP